jgi:uncharacterized OsmC-like protein
VVLGALAGCLTAGIATTAAAKKVELRSVTSTVVGEIDVRGVLAIDKTVRPGFDSVRVSFEVDADADADTIASIVEGSRRTSAVYDMLSGTTPVEITVG